MRHISECVTCQLNKSEPILPPGLLQPLPTPEQTWESSSLDFITGLLKAQGKDEIPVGIDRLTNLEHFLMIPIDYIVVQRAELFFRETFRLHRENATTGAVDSLALPRSFHPCMRRGSWSWFLRRY
jgi:hypothetical protein